MTGTSVVLPRHHVFTHDELARPLPVWNPKRYLYASARRFLSGFGRCSDGVAIGERYGFDSGVMLDYVYRNKAHGKNPLGYAIDRVFLNAPSWRGIRDRGALVQRVLDKEITIAKAANREVHLLDVACGGGRYVVETLARHHGDVASAQLRDYRSENIDAARGLARTRKVVAHFAQADAFDSGDLARVQPKPNLVIVSGLHEIIADDALIQRHFHQIAHNAARPATLVFTIQPWHPQLEFIARVLKSHTGKPWVMRLRPWETTRAWAEAAGFTIRCVKMEPQRIFGVVIADLA